MRVNGKAWGAAGATPRISNPAATNHRIFQGCRFKPQSHGKHLFRQGYGDQKADQDF